MDIIPEPIGPPCQEFKDTFCGLLVETEESKRKTAEWQKESDEWSRKWEIINKEIMKS